MKSSLRPSNAVCTSIMGKQVRDICTTNLNDQLRGLFRVLMKCRVALGAKKLGHLWKKLGVFGKSWASLIKDPHLSKKFSHLGSKILIFQKVAPSPHRLKPSPPTNPHLLPDFPHLHVNLFIMSWQFDNSPPKSSFPPHLPPHPRSSFFAQHPDVAIISWGCWWWRRSEGGSTNSRRFATLDRAPFDHFSGFKSPNCFKLLPKFPLYSTCFHSTQFNTTEEVKFR